MPDRPLKKPDQFLKVLETLNTPGAKNMMDPQSYVNLVGEYAKKAHDSGELSFREYMGIVKPLFGRAGEIVSEKIAERDRELNKYSIGGRVGFENGTDKDFNRNPDGKNQYTANMRTDAEIQKIIDSKPKNWTKKDFRGEGKLNDKKILTRKETDRPGLKFYHSGKRIFKDSRGNQNLKASQFNKATQGSAITMDKINNFAHFAPKILTYLTSTADTGPLKAKVNRAAEGYDKKALEIAKKQEKLITEKPKGYKLKLDAANKEAREASVNANKKLPKDLKGTLGYFVVNPNTGEFKLKGVDKAKTFAGISGEKREFKSMDPSERANYGKTQSVVQSLIDKVKSKFPNVKTTRASNVSIPQKTLTANMFKTAFKGAGGSQDGLQDPLGGPDLINVKKYNKNPYDDVF